MRAIRGNFIFKLLSEWHCSSGLTGTSEVDLTVVKDDDGFPYIPGRTVKGLLRDFATNIFESSGDDKWNKFIKNIFGAEGNMPGKITFSNAVMPNNFKEGISKIGDTAIRHIYTRRTFTKIDERTGVAEDKTLRSIEFVIPLTMVSEWHYAGDISLEDLNMLKTCTKGVKRLGVNRNRGFGRCECLCVEEPAGA